MQNFGTVSIKAQMLRYMFAPSWNDEGHSTNSIIYINFLTITFTLYTADHFDFLAQFILSFHLPILVYVNNDQLD